MSIVELQRKTMLKGLFKEGALHHSQPFNQRSKFGVNYFIESEYGMLSLFGGIADSIIMVAFYVCEVTP